MNIAKDLKKYPVVPPSELRCVWMTAGILSYQLCSRKFNCEDCPLDSAMRMHFSQRASDASILKKEYSSTFPTRGLRPECFYSLNHCWIKRQDRSSVRIGIEPKLASILLSPRAIVLPTIGEHLQQDTVCAWVITEGGTLQIASPLQGEVWSVNASLTERPHDLHHYPLDRGWLYELVVNEEEFESAKLLRMAEAEKKYADDASKFQSLLQAEFERNRAATDTTLPDGGQLLRNVADMLGAEKYFKLVRQAFM